LKFNQFIQEKRQVHQQQQQQQQQQWKGNILDGIYSIGLNNNNNDISVDDDDSMTVVDKIIADLIGPVMERVMVTLMGLMIIVSVLLLFFLLTLAVCIVTLLRYTRAT
jgi:hypothetical protein